MGFKICPVALVNSCWPVILTPGIKLAAFAARSLVIVASAAARSPDDLSDNFLPTAFNPSPPTFLKSSRDPPSASLPSAPHNETIVPRVASHAAAEIGSRESGPYAT